MLGTWNSRDIYVRVCVQEEESLPSVLIAQCSRETSDHVMLHMTL
jgi:hypothetical protein